MTSGLPFTGLLDDMIQCVAGKQCPHYFVRQENLFEGISDDMLQHVGCNLERARKTLSFGRYREPNFAVNKLGTAVGKG